MNEMTRREFFEAIKQAEGLDVELKLFAEKEIEKMDARNAKRKGSPSKKAVENAPIKEAIVELLNHYKELTGEPLPASEVGEKVGISTAKASALLRQIDRLVVEEIKVKGRKVKGYKIV